MARKKFRLGDKAVYICDNRKDFLDSGLTLRRVQIQKITHAGYDISEYQFDRYYYEDEGMKRGSEIRMELCHEKLCTDEEALKIVEGFLNAK